uniref:von Willebrand factor A domain-containing protein 1 n=1 Tax=Amphiprion percula TaxID=161767 RepID=A0A3P8T8Q2_AMPPE
MYKSCSHTLHSFTCTFLLRNAKVEQSPSTTSVQPTPLIFPSLPPCVCINSYRCFTLLKHLFLFSLRYQCFIRVLSDASLPDCAVLPHLLYALLNCCEGDILVLLDSSGSVANYEFSRLLLFVTELLGPFSLGRGHVRVALLQVGTEPHLEFSLDVHSSQESLQKALRSVVQLQGDTNTEAALRVTRRLLTKTEDSVPKILLWLTDGVQPGDVDEPMSELKALGVSVLVVSTVHGNFQVLQRVVTPPLESHLYSVDIDNIDIITEDLREAIIKRLRVVHLTSHSAVLQWRPVLSADSGYYELWYSSIRKANPEIRRTLSGDSSKVELTNLQPETTYTASLHPETNLGLQKLILAVIVSLVSFLPADVLSPAVISLSDSGPRQIRVSWGPLQPTRVQRYTVEYGTIPSGRVHTVTLHSQKNSTLLTRLEPNTQYLVTVSALHVDGKERAMSVRACTQEGTVTLIF